MPWATNTGGEQTPAHSAASGRWPVARGHCEHGDDKRSLPDERHRPTSTSCGRRFMQDAPITLSPYDPRWAVLFEQERVSLEAALAHWLVGPVEHIGSTSVPGLAAKPIIDMMAPVRSLSEAAAAVEPMTTLGYRNGVHRPEEAHYFFKPDTDNWWERTHQLHLTQPTSILWRRRIAFRDALRRHAHYRTRYEQLKRDLANTHGTDLMAYARNKDDFVNEVLGVRDKTEAPPRHVGGVW